MAWATIALSCGTRDPEPLHVPSGIVPQLDSCQMPLAHPRVQLRILRSVTCVKPCHCGPVRFPCASISASAAACGDVAVALGDLGRKKRWRCHCISSLCHAKSPNLHVGLPSSVCLFGFGPHTHTHTNEGDTTRDSTVSVWKLLVTQVATQLTFSAFITKIPRRFLRITTTVTEVRVVEAWHGTYWTQQMTWGALDFADGPEHRPIT